MDWYSLINSEFCVILIALFIFLFRELAHVISTDCDYEEITTARTLTEESHSTRSMPPSMPLPQAGFVEEHQFVPSQNSPYPRNLPPLGFEAISTMYESDLNEEPYIGNTRAPYPLEDEIDIMPQPTSSISTPAYRDRRPHTTEAHYIPARNSREDSETGETYHYVEPPPSYEEAVDYRSSPTRRRFREVGFDIF